MTHLHSHGNMSPSQAVYGRVYSVSGTGGLVLSDTTPNLSFGSTTRQMLNLWGTSYGIGVQAYTTYLRCDGSHPAWKDLLGVKAARTTTAEEMPTASS